MLKCINSAHSEFIVSDFKQCYLIYKYVPIHLIYFIYVFFLTFRRLTKISVS